MPGMSQTLDLGSLSPQLQRERNSESTEDQCAQPQDTGCNPRPLHLASDPTFLSHFAASAAQPLSPPGVKTLGEGAGGQLIWGPGRLPRREDKELGSQAPWTGPPLLPQACLGAGPSLGERSSVHWLHRCCFCLGLKIASSLPLFSSGWERGDTGGQHSSAAERAQTRGHRGPPGGTETPGREGGPPGGTGDPLGETGDSGPAS